MTKHFGFTPQTPSHEIAANQRKHLRNAADRIERGESLEGIDVEFVAVALRAFADRIPNVPPKSRGGTAKVNASGLAIARVLTGKTMEKLAESAEVSVEAVSKALRKEKPLMTVLKKLHTARKNSTK